MLILVTILRLAKILKTKRSVFAESCILLKDGVDL
jgi:hypothetical protein